MLALPTEAMQKFCIAFSQIVTPGHGSKAKAARIAGYDCKPNNFTTLAIGLLMRDDVKAALAELDTAHQAELRPLYYKAMKKALANPAGKHHGIALKHAGDRIWPSEQLHRHQHELSEDKAEIFLKLVEQRIREGRSDKEIRAELERQGDAAAVSAADYYLARARANAVDVEAVEVTTASTKEQGKLKQIEAKPEVDEDW
jgi:hypothetical protein